MISNYTLTKSVINNNVSSFKNKFEFDYYYNDALEVIQDKVIRYDSNNNVIKYDETNYTYDTCGNILSINKKDGNNQASIFNDTTYIFSYDDEKLQRVYNALTDYYKEYSYDYYGNIISIKHYDNHDNLLKEERFIYTRKSLIDSYQVFENNILTKSYRYYYNYLGVRYKKEDILNNTYIYYTTNKNNIIYSSNCITYLYGENESSDRLNLLGFNYNNKTYFYIKDEIGNIVSIVSDGVENVRYIYDSYGNHQVYEVNSNGELILNNNLSFIGNINPFRYKSYYYDTENNLYYLNSRYYDSSICRFISPDDISYLDSSIINGLNLYCYCNNNPVMYSDPDGMFALSVFLISIAIGAAFSLAGEFASDLLDGNGIDHDFKYYLAAGVSGAIGGMAGGLGLNFLGSALFSAVGDVTSGIITKEIDTGKEVLKTATKSILFSALSFSISSAVSGFVSNQQLKKLSSISKDNSKVNKVIKMLSEKRYKEFSNLKIGKNESQLLKAFTRTKLNVSISQAIGDTITTVLSVLSR